MGIRRLVNRVARNGRLWFLILLGGMFYLNLASLARSAERANKRHSREIPLKEGGGEVGGDEEDEQREDDDGQEEGDSHNGDYDEGEEEEEEEEDDDGYKKYGVYGNENDEENEENRENEGDGDEDENELQDDNGREREEGDENPDEKANRTHKEKQEDREGDQIMKPIKGDQKGEKGEVGKLDSPLPAIPLPLLIEKLRPGKRGTVEKVGGGVNERGDKKDDGHPVGSEEERGAVKEGVGGNLVELGNENQIMKFGENRIGEGNGEADEKEHDGKLTKNENENHDKNEDADRQEKNGHQNQINVKDRNVAEKETENQKKRENASVHKDDDNDQTKNEIKNQGKNTALHAVQKEHVHQFKSRDENSDKDSDDIHAIKDENQAKIALEPSNKIDNLKSSRKPHDVNELGEGLGGDGGDGEGGGGIDGGDGGPQNKVAEVIHQEEEAKDIAYDGYYHINETLTGGKPVIKVILLTYQRAGSSFTGELLTSGGEAVYVYEPLFVWRKLLGPGADPKVEENSAKVLGDLLDCRPEVVLSWRRKGYPYFKRRGDWSRNWCSNAPLRLLKTIRAREHFTHAWLARRPDIKVVHLVRDPRGVLNSVARGGWLWSKNNRDAALQCAYMQKDMTLQDLGPGRYLRVRYEDLVDRPLEETRRVLTFMGVELNLPVLTYLRQHTGIAKHTHQEKEKYLNTYREADFRHDHWKERMDPQHMVAIERACSTVMKLLDYQPLQPA